MSKNIPVYEYRSAAGNESNVVLLVDVLQYGCTVPAGTRAFSFNAGTDGFKPAAFAAIRKVVPEGPIYVVGFAPLAERKARGMKATNRWSNGQVMSSGPAGPVKHVAPAAPPAVDVGAIAAAVAQMLAQQQAAPKAKAKGKVVAPAS